jgi:hypothetical protein
LSLKFYAKITFTAVFLHSPAGPIIVIASIAMVILLKLAKEHTKGLTEKQITQFAVDQLKVGFRNLDVFTSQEEFDGILKTRTTKLHDIGFRATDDANALCYIALPIYLPSKDIQPRFKIHSTELSDDQIQGLLEVAFEKGIILEFTSFKRMYNDTRTPNYLSKPDDLQYTRERMEKAFKISVQFLEGCLKKENVVIEKINAQLNALGFKWDTPEGDKVMKSPIYLEEDKTLVIRGNCNEIPDITEAVMQLSEWVDEIKVYQLGLGFDFLISRDKWINFKDNFPESKCSVTFIGNELQEKQDNHSIWQKEPHKEPGFWDRLQSFTEDFKRVQENTKAKENPQPLAG